MLIQKITNRMFKPMTPKQLARNDRLWIGILTLGVGFLLWDVYHSVRQDVPVFGWLGYVTGPIFAHKISEIMLLAMWMPVFWMINYSRAKIYPRRMPPERYRRLLRCLLSIAPFQIVLATYAWTIVNLGTSSLTTDFPPLIFREEGWVWRWYLGAVVVGGMIFIPLAIREVVALTRSETNKNREQNSVRKQQVRVL